MNAVFDANDRTTVLIHGSDIFTAAKIIGKRIDYQKLLDWLQQQTSLICPYFFLMLGPEGEYDATMRMKDWLTWHHYTVITKNRTSGDRAKSQENLDNEFGLHILKNSQNRHCNHLLLFCGEADVASAIMMAKENGVKVTVCSVFNTNREFINNKVRAVANFKIDLNDIIHNFLFDAKDSTDSISIADDIDDYKEDIGP